MRRADRLFDIIQCLRTARGPMTAAALAEELEVTVRTVYRDVATLQARRVPIEGAAGIGYLLRRGFDLPPLMFTTEEIEAIAVGARLVARTGDPGLQDAAKGADCAGRLLTVGQRPADGRMARAAPK
jgi:predicted DNA-binding transcriptional regulator YafY